MLVIQGIKKVVSGSRPEYSNHEIKRKAGKFVFNIVLIIRVGKGGICKKFGIEYMVPPHRSGGVSPIEIKIKKVAVEPKYIPAKEVHPLR